MAYEEAAYQSVYQGEGFEVRFYEERIVIQTRFQGSNSCLLYTSPSPRDATLSRMPSSA